MYISGTVLPPPESDMEMEQDEFVDLTRSAGRRPPVAPFIPPSQPSAHLLEKTHATAKPALLQPGTTSSTPGTVNLPKFSLPKGGIPQVTTQQLSAIMGQKQVQAILNQFSPSNGKQNQVKLNGIPPSDTSNLTASGIVAPALDIGAVTKTSVAPSGQLHSGVQSSKVVPVSQGKTFEEDLNLPQVSKDLGCLELKGKASKPNKLYPSKPAPLFEDG